MDASDIIGYALMGTLLGGAIITLLFVLTATFIDGVWGTKIIQVLATGRRDD